MQDRPGYSIELRLPRRSTTMRLPGRKLPATPRRTRKEIKSSQNDAIGQKTCGANIFHRTGEGQTLTRLSSVFRSLPQFSPGHSGGVINCRAVAMRKWKSSRAAQWVLPRAMWCHFLGWRRTPVRGYGEFKVCVENGETKHLTEAFPILLPPALRSDGGQVADSAKRGEGEAHSTRRDYSETHSKCCCLAASA